MGGRIGHSCTRTHPEPVLDELQVVENLVDAAQHRVTIVMIVDEADRSDPTIRVGDLLQEVLLRPDAFACVHLPGEESFVDDSILWGARQRDRCASLPRARIAGCLGLDLPEVVGERTP